MIKQNMKYFNRLFVILDAILIGLALLLSWVIRFKTGWIPIEGVYLSFSEYMQPMIIIVPSFLILYNFFALYIPHRMKSSLDEIISLLKANAIGIIVFIGVLYLMKNVNYSRVMLALFLSLNVLLGTIERLIIRRILHLMRKKGFNKKHIVLVGFCDLTVEYLQRLMTNEHWGYEVSGIFDDKIEKGTVQVMDKSFNIIGKLEDLEAYLLINPLDEVIITLPLAAYLHLDQVIESCEKSGIFTRIVPDYYKYIPSQPEVEDIDGLPVISIRKVPLNDVVYNALKRSLDICAALAGLICLSPLLLLLLCVIKITSKGPVLYKQERVGLNRKMFWMYKFRSMVVQDETSEKSGWTTKDDPRVTKIGKFMRRTSMDELPQLFNVLIGEMSLVGPRPERPQFVDIFKEEIPKYMVKHQVRPGMTGWAQIHGWRGDTSIDKRIEFDIYYIENWSLALDIKIIVLTVFKGLVNHNAY